MVVLADNLVNRVAEIIPRYSMLTAGERLGVAVSGGADSTVLLHILKRLGWALVVLHVNHQLRGAESDADEDFVRELAQSLNLPVQVERRTPGSGNLEQEARRARREFFLRAMQEHGLRRVALGHTRSDQAETVLFRLLRGTGLAGLAGMLPVTDDGLIRPLLTTSRDEIRRWATAEGIRWREDSSNNDLTFARNRLRQETLPDLADTYNPNLEAVLAGTAKLAQAEEAYWSELIEPLYGKIAKRTSLGLIFQTGDLGQLRPAVRRRLLRRALIDVRGDLRGLDLEHIEAVLALCRSEQGHNRVLIPGVDALRSFDRLLVTRQGRLSEHPRGYSLVLRMGQICELPFANGVIYVNWVKSASDFCANFKKEPQIREEMADLDGDVLAGDGTLDRWQVRNWEPGDELHRPGHRAGEKIKSLFQSERVLLWERRHWPLVTAGREVIWARKFGGAAKWSATGESRRIVRLIYRAGDMSEKSSGSL
jgi:tRNA(Ile)-lysidine synthase